MSAIDEARKDTPSGQSGAFEGSRSGADRRGPLLAAGGILAGIGAASCCVLPFALFMLGIGGAWIVNLTALEPYQPLFIVLALGAIGYGFRVVYRKPKAACDDGSYCASPRSIRVTKVGLWVATFVVVIAIGFPRLAPLFL